MKKKNTIHADVFSLLGPGLLFLFLVAGVSCAGGNTRTGSRACPLPSRIDWKNNPERDIKKYYDEIGKRVVHAKAADLILHQTGLFQNYAKKIDGKT